MNRQQRRQMMRMAQKDPRSFLCRTCGKKTFFVAEHADDIDHYDVYCSVCGERIGRAKEGTNGVEKDDPIVDMRKWTKGDIRDKVRGLIDKVMDQEIPEKDKENMTEKEKVAAAIDMLSKLDNQTEKPEEVTVETISEEPKNTEEENADEH